MPDELKPCPWCGSPARFYEIARSYQAEPQWAIICTRDKDTFCPAGVPHFAHNEQQVTANMWNCRAQETIAIQDLRSENAKLKAEVRSMEERWMEERFEHNILQLECSKLKARVEAAEELICASNAFGAVFIMPDEIVSEEDKLFQEAFATSRLKDAYAAWEKLK